MSHDDAAVRAGAPVAHAGAPADALLTFVARVARECAAVRQLLADGIGHGAEWRLRDLERDARFLLERER